MRMIDRVGRNDYKLSDKISPINTFDTLATGMITLFSVACAQQG